MRWGGGKWPTSFKRAASPWVGSAIGITQDALDYFDLAYEDPKVVTVWCVSRNWNDGTATAEGTGDIELYLPYNLLKRKKVGRHVSGLALTVFHEAVHCVREEAVAQNNLLERVVTEGVASAGERLLAHALFTPEEIANHASEFSGNIDPKTEAALLDHLMDDAAYEAYLSECGDPNSDEIIDDIYRAWFDGSDPTVLGAGNILGITAVSRLIDAGVPYAEIVSLPTEDILTLPTQFAA